MKKLLGFIVLAGLSVSLLGNQPDVEKDRLGGEALGGALIFPLIAGSLFQYVCEKGLKLTDTAPRGIGRPALFHICKGPGHTVLQCIGGGAVVAAASTGCVLKNRLSNEQKLALLSLGTFGAGILCQYINF